jgi:VanZ family protein
MAAVPAGRHTSGRTPTPPVSSPPPTTCGHRWRFGYPLALACTLIWLSSTPGPQVELPPGIPWDKLAHFLLYGLLATHICRLFSGRQLSLRTGLIAIGSVSLFGLSDELHQLTNPARSFEWLDWVADALGALVAVYVYQRWSWYRSILEWQPRASARRAPTRIDKRSRSLP